MSVDWEPVALAFTTITAVVSAISSAVSAFRSGASAEESAKTSRQAMEALTAIVRPEVRTHSILQGSRGDGVARVQVANFSDTPNAHDAWNVSVIIERRDGRTFKGRSDWLHGPPTTAVEHGELVGSALPRSHYLRHQPTKGALEVEIGEVDPLTQTRLVCLVVNRITITFSDHRRLATYRRHEDYSALTPSGELDPPALPRVNEEIVTARYLE